MSRRRTLTKLAPLAPVVTLLVIVTLASGKSPQAHTGHGIHEVQVPAAAAVALAAPVDRAAWTVTASDQETAFESAPASAAIDGSASTYWHSKWSGTAAPFPHSITIDMHASTVVSALTYVPRPAVEKNGRIGRFTVSLSTDGTTWGSPVATGTWADDTETKTASFQQQATRYVRLTATTEAGNRGPWSSAAELNLLGATTTQPAYYSPLSRGGWTAKASDQETAGESGVAANVLDGLASTHWHSSYSNPSVPLPHTITIDMGQSQAVSGLRYLPRAGGGNGTIGQYKIATSTDGSSFTDVSSGTWANTAVAKDATFATVTTRYVRLTALTEAGNRGPWSSAAEIDLLQKSATAPNLGAWGPVINFPIVPVSAVLLPDNKLLTFSAYSPGGFSMNGSPATPNGDSLTQTAILDLATGTVSQRAISNTEHQMFCTGLALLPDGRVLVDGGSDSGVTSIYSPSTNTWSKGPKLNIPRGYQGDTTLSTGEVFTLGGSWNGGEGGKDGEVFTPNGSWRKLSGVTADSILTKDPRGPYRADNHGWFFATSNGGVFHAGPSKQMNWFTTSGAGSTTSAGNRLTSDDAMNGNAVMYDVNKIVTLGGATAYQDVDATTKAFTIDIGKGPNQPVDVKQTGSMTYARAFANSVVLPDGKVIVIGGQPHPVPFTDTDASLTPELWDPATGRFTSMAPMANPRTYHSVAVLLPDGRVFSGGGGLCGNGCATNHPDGQIFTPPYLLKADGTARTRPSLSSAPTTASRGSTISVTAASGLSKFALVRTGATTHTVNSDQRRVPVSIASASGTSYRLNIPSDSGVALPGYYLLFALDANGTPSIAKTVRVS